MEDIVTIFVYSFWIAAACALIYTAIDTPIRPVQNWLTSWRDSFGYAYRHHRLTLWIALVYLISPCLDFIFGRHNRMEPNTFVEMKMAWQLIAAGILAFMAVRIHYWAALDVFDRDHAPPYEPVHGREFWAALIGSSVVVVIFVISLGLTLALAFCPQAWLPLGGVLGDSLRALAFSVLSLIRPCLSLGAPQPIRAAVIAFSRRPLGFFLWVTAVCLPAMLMQSLLADSFVLIGTPSLFFWGSRLALALFQIFNYIAFEMTTVRMVQDLSIAPEERFDLGVAETS